jgi:hypothetical protein
MPTDVPALWREISKEDCSRLRRLVARRAAQLNIDVKSVEDGSLAGSFYDSPRGVAEFAMHEVAHLLTLGLPVPEGAIGRIQDAIHARLKPFSVWVADELEIDTAFVTYHAGLELNLWTTDARPRVIASCTKAIERGQRAKSKVEAGFDQRDERTSIFSERVSALQNWFIGRSKDLFPLRRIQSTSTVPKGA